MHVCSTQRGGPSTAIIGKGHVKVDGIDKRACGVFPHINHVFCLPLHHLFMTAAPPSVPVENVMIL